MSRASSGADAEIGHERSRDRTAAGSRIQRSRLSGVFGKAAGDRAPLGQAGQARADLAVGTVDTGDRVAAAAAVGRDQRGAAARPPATAARTARSRRSATAAGDGQRREGRVEPHPGAAAAQRDEGDGARGTIASRKMGAAEQRRRRRRNAVTPRSSSAAAPRSATSDDEPAEGSNGRADNDHDRGQRVDVGAPETRVGPAASRLLDQ